MDIPAQEERELTLPPPSVQALSGLDGDCRLR